MKMLNKILGNIFSYGVLCALFAGALAGLGFIVAFVIGGNTATEICTFIHTEYFPIVIQVCTISTGCGLLTMYLQKKKALTMETEK